MDQSKGGAVLLSFGTFADSSKMRKTMKMAFLRAFSQFSDYEFIWQMALTGEEAKMIDSYKNIHSFKWIDQKSVLSKSNI